MATLQVPFNSQARRILDCQHQSASPFVFPSPANLMRPRSAELSLWYRVRHEAGIEDTGLHGLRHAHASHAVMNGAPVPGFSRLLGHPSVRMTLRYAHVADKDVKAATERIGGAITAICKGPGE